jgi:predicted metal-dependent enzyme (double-stranded beta helix superfamily)
MIGQDWLVNNEGKPIPQQSIFSSHPLDRPYRLYRFLTDVEDILDLTTDNEIRLQKIFPLLRRLLTSSEWLQLEYIDPDPDLGWSVVTLYDEPEYPLTLQMVSWSPGMVSPIHNHGTWGIVALLEGQEKNTLWQSHPHGIECIDERILNPGDIIGFLPDAIHQIATLGEKPTISFNIYGETDYDRRREFDPFTGQTNLY